MNRREEYTEAIDGPVRSRAGRWRVIDVMATDVITADKNMPYKQVARLLADNDLSAVPVLSSGGRVLGVVSEADVLRREERSFSRLAAGLPRRTHREREQAEALTAAQLMTTPAITIHPDAPLGAAARLMNAHHVGRLPVVNPAGELIGIVSRRDLMSVFLRPDAEIAAEIADQLALMPEAETMRIAVSDRRRRGRADRRAAERGNDLGRHQGCVRRGRRGRRFQQADRQAGAPRGRIACAGMRPPARLFIPQGVSSRKRCPCGRRSGSGNSRADS